MGIDTIIAFNKNMSTDYKNYFKDKKITVMGLGLLGRGIGDVKFLAACGAELTVTDLKSEDELAPAIEELARDLTPEQFNNINFVLGEHRLEDFRDCDMLLRAPNAPLDSEYLAEARAHRVSIKMDASLFVELAPKDITIVGVTGTRGKTTVSHIIFDIAKRWFHSRYLDHGAPRERRVVLAGNTRGTATLPLLAEVESGDIVVLELDSWQLQGFGEAKISPHIGVFTCFYPDHLNYYKGLLERYFDDKTHVFSHQSPKDTLIIGTQINKLFEERFITPPSRLIIARGRDLPSELNLRMIGEHNKSNVAMALAVVKLLGVEENFAREAASAFSGVQHRLQHVGVKHGVVYYNDTTATSPEGVRAALRALQSYAGRVILLAGGADKGLDYGELVEIFPEYLKAIILFKGAASDKIFEKIMEKPDSRRAEFEIASQCTSMVEALKRANDIAEPGDVVLLSPGAASFGVFKNEYDRGDQFIAGVKKIV